MAALTRLGVTGSARAYPPFTAKRDANPSIRQEINFRSSVPYRSDDSIYAHVQAGTSVNFPTVTAQGNTVGWEQIGASPYENSVSLTVDVRLAGAYASLVTGLPSIYRINLPAPGKYSIRCAAGRLDAARGANIRMFDDSTLLSEIIPAQSQSAAGTFFDAANVELDKADWPVMNQSIDLTFTSNVLRIYNAGTGSSATVWGYIAHFSVESASAPPPGLGSGGMRIIELRRRKS